MTLKSYLILLLKMLQIYKIIKKILKHKHNLMDQMVLLKVKKNQMVYHLLVKKKNKKKKKKKKKNMLKQKKNMLQQKKKVIKKNIMMNKYQKKIVQEVKKMILLKINKMFQLNNYHLKLKKNKLNYKVIIKMMIKIQMITKIVKVKNQILSTIVSNIKKIQKM